MYSFTKLNRHFSVVKYNDEEQKHYLNLRAVPKYGVDAVFIADDSEWDTSKHRSNDVDLRKQDDIISHQYVLKYGEYPAMGIVIYRKPGDKPFSYWDLISVVRYYLTKVGYKAEYTDGDYLRLSKQLGISKDKVISYLGDTSRVPMIVWTGFFGGVDATAYEDWWKYLDRQRKKSADPHLIALNKQEFFSSPYSVLITNPNSRRHRYPVTIKFSDTMALGPQGGLAALGAIVGQAKIDTKKWDLQDGLITYRQYKDPTYGGYYKQHMRYLLEQRPKDYQRYALGDSEVTLKYLNVLMGNVIGVYNDGLIDKVHVPATLTSLADEISSHFSKLPFDDTTTKDIYDSIFEDIDVEKYLRPVTFNQQPPRDVDEWKKVLTAVLDGSSLPGDSRRFGYQKLFIKKLRPYLARGTVAYRVTGSGHLYRRLTCSASTEGSMEQAVTKLATLIDYEHLYADNPKFNIEDLSNQKIKPSKMTFDISTTLRNHFADHAHQFVYTRSNVPPTIDQVLLRMYDDSLYFSIPWFGNQGIVTWTPVRYLVQCLDFDKMRKGYSFVEPSAIDRKHQKGSHDRFSVRPDSVYNDGYAMAVLAYVGGMNLAFNPGIIGDGFKYKIDVDLVSCYVECSHLIPDFRLDVKPLFDCRDLDTQDLIDLRPKLPNGVFTIGITNVSYHFPDDVKRVPVGYKPPIKGTGPVYVRQANRVDMTLTDVFDIIKHGGSVRVHRLIVPVQKTLTGDVKNLAPISRMQHWSLTKRNAAKAERDKYSADSEQYHKFDALQLFYKLLGNGGYGKSGQGLGSGGTRDFLTGDSMYIPFSRNTNPYTAAQYTSLARYQVNSLMDLMEKLYPDSLIPSVTTDGFIFCTNDDFDAEELRSACESNFDKRWVRVSRDEFNGQFFELKSHNHGQVYSTTPLYNIRTRFNMTVDGHIKALVGLQPGEWTVDRVVDAINSDVVTFKVDDFRMESLNDMKHSEDAKHYTSMKTWRQPKYLNFSPDDTYQPVGFVQQGDFGYYLTRPFATVDELLNYRAEVKPYRSIFPAFRKKYAEQFIKLDQSVKPYTHGSRRELHVAWVHDDVTLKGNGYLDLLDNYQSSYVSDVVLRCLGQHEDEYDLKKIYEAFYSQRYKRFASFHQAVRRGKRLFVNPLCVIKEAIPDKLKDFEISKDL